MYFNLPSSAWQNSSSFWAQRASRRMVLLPSHQLSGPNLVRENRVQHTQTYTTHTYARAERASRRMVLLPSHQVSGPNLERENTDQHTRTYARTQARTYARTERVRQNGIVPVAPSIRTKFSKRKYGPTHTYTHAHTQARTYAQKEWRRMVLFPSHHVSGPNLVRENRAQQNRGSQANKEVKTTKQTRHEWVKRKMRKAKDP